MLARLHGLSGPVKRQGTAPTLAAWLRARDAEQVSWTCLLNVTKHWMVVSGRKGGDNRTGAPVFLRDMPRRRSLLRAAYRLECVDPGKLREFRR